MLKTTNMEGNCNTPLRNRREPSLHFRLSKSGILLVQNNESGIQDNNFKALCSVGDTTKKNKRSGYIGEKGIGFKSIFAVCSTPHIFSNGFQFSFDEKPDPQANLGNHT